MVSIEHSSVIRFLKLEHLSPTHFHSEMRESVYCDNTPGYDTIKSWSRQFRSGRGSVEDDERTGRPVEVRTKKKVDEIL